MDFELSEEQSAFRQAAREFAAGEMAPLAAQWDAECIFPVETIRKAGELGFCGMYSSQQDGGMGLSRLDAVIVFEELAAACPSTTAYMTIHNMVSWMLATWASPAVRERWAPLLASGRKLGSYCLTEPGAGSDAGALTMRAERKGGFYHLNGSKAFISGAGATDLLIVMARTGGAGPKGISAFAVPADTAGVGYGRKEVKMGWNSQPTRVVSFDDVRIPADHLLAEEGEGFRIAMRGLDGGRINIAPCSVGAAQAALAAARLYMGERRQLGQRLASSQPLPLQLAARQTEPVAAWQLVRPAAAQLDAGGANASVYCAMAKRIATDIGFKVCNQALQIHGGNGYIREYPLERYLRDVRVHQILEGTNEIMRVIVVRHLLDNLTPEEIR